MRARWKTMFWPKGSVLIGGIVVLVLACCGISCFVQVAGATSSVGSQENSKDGSQEVAAASEDLEWLAQAPEGNGPEIQLPTEPVTMFIRYPGPRSRFQMIFSDVPEGMAVQNDIGYDGWCVDRQLQIPKNTTHKVRLYSSTDPMLPGHLARLPWNEINYLINHKEGKTSDVQAAIWHLVDGRNRGMTPAARALVEEARRNAAHYVPRAGETLAVITEPHEGLQTTFIEYPLPVVLGAEGEAPSPQPEPPAPSVVTRTVTRVVTLPSFFIPGDPSLDTRIVSYEEPPDEGEDEPSTPVPLPNTMVLLVPGLAAVVALGKRHRQ